MSPALTSSGRDDLDLDGNWQSSTAAPAPEPAESARRKRPRDEALAGPEEEPRKKKKKKRRRVAVAVPNTEGLGRSGVRLKTAWAAEVKARRLTPLEEKEVLPLDSWFIECPEDGPVAKLPWRLDPSTSSSPALRTLVAARDAASLPSAAPRSASFTILCASTDRVFAVIEEIQEAWKCKPFALAPHGGGRKRDQIQRQAQALQRGIPVAVATPGRLLRLLDEGHVDVGSMEAVALDLARDLKQRDLLGIPETRRELFDLLQRHVLPSRRRGGRPLLALCEPVPRAADNPPEKAKTAHPPKRKAKTAHPLKEKAKAAHPPKKKAKTALLPKKAKTATPPKEAKTARKAKRAAAGSTSK